MMDRGSDIDSRGKIALMRLVDFWDRMAAVFGPAYARSWAADQRLAQLGGRTVEQALADAVDTREVWRAVVSAYPVPRHLR